MCVRVQGSYALLLQYPAWFGVFIHSCALNICYLLEAFVCAKTTVLGDLSTLTAINVVDSPVEGAKFNFATASGVILVCQYFCANSLW